MNRSNANMARALSSCLVLACVLVASSLYAEQPTKISGKITAEITRQDTVAVGDTEGHNMYLQVSDGTNSSTGEEGFMAGALIHNVAFADIVRGNGVHQGYVKFTKGGSSAFAGWEGKVTTTLTSDSTSVISHEGTFSYIGGTGRFENIKGGGKYSGRYTSTGGYVTEWQGEYSLED